MLATLLTATTCLVVTIADGDTLTARCGQLGTYRQVKINLAAIDAPEKYQPYGRKSRDRLAELCFHTYATIKPVGKNRDGRTIARVECEGKDANLEMVKDGLAWAYTKYQTNAAFPRAETDARQQRVGLWAALDTAEPPIPPWEFRHQLSATTPDASGCFTGPNGDRYRIVNNHESHGC